MTKMIAYRSVAGYQIVGVAVGQADRVIVDKA